MKSPTKPENDEVHVSGPRFRFWQTGMILVPLLVLSLGFACAWGSFDSPGQPSIQKVGWLVVIFGAVLGAVFIPFALSFKSVVLKKNAIIVYSLFHPPETMPVDEMRFVEIAHYQPMLVTIHKFDGSRFRYISGTKGFLDVSDETSLLYEIAQANRERRGDNGLCEKR